MEYTIVGASSVDEMSKLVNELIAKGWKPQGGIAFLDGENGFVLNQAMVRIT